MQIEHKLQVAGIALLLSLVAIAGPANSQVPENPEDCLDGDGTLPFGPIQPDPTCIAPPEAPDCPDGTIGEFPECAPDLSQLPTLECTPEPSEEFFTCLSDFIADSLPDADAEVCSALGSDGETAQECVQAALDAAVCGVVGEEGTTAQACIAEEVPSECPAQAPGTFPQCTDAVTAIVETALGTIVALLAPTVTVTAPATAEAGDTVTVAITVSSDLPLTGLASLTITPPGGPAGTSQAVALTDGEGSVNVLVDEVGSYTFLVEAEYEEDLTGFLTSSASDSTVVENPDLDISFVIDSLGNQRTGYAVQVTGSATANVDLAGADISISLTPGQTLTGSGQETIVWTDGNVQSLDLSGGDSEAFEAFVVWNVYEDVSWTIDVDGFAQDFTVTFSDEATEIHLGAGNAAATLDVQPLSQITYEPDNSATPLLTSAVFVTDTNGAGDGSGTHPLDGEADGSVVDDNLAATISKGADSDVVSIGDGENANAVQRDFDLSYSLPARLKDGTYTLETTYTNPVIDGETEAKVTEPVSKTLVVENVEPVISVPAVQQFPGTERIASFGVVSFTVDDFNAGDLSGNAVVELTTLTLVVREAAAIDCTGAVTVQGLAISFPIASGATPTGNVLSFANVAFDEALDVQARLAWSTTALAGSYELCATLSDGVDQHAGVLLADFTLVALNGGFHLTIDDGGNGLDAPGVEPGEETSTDFLSIGFSGTVGASELEFTVGQFKRNGGPVGFTAEDVSGTLCLTQLCEGDDFIGTVNEIDGVIAFTGLEDVALPGGELLVKFTFTLPIPTPAGNYAAPVTVAGLAAPPAPLP